jgi:hypothetical protein
MMTGASPKGAGALPRAGVGALRASTGLFKPFRSAQDGDCGATVARRAAGTGGPETNVSIARADRVARRALAGAATALKNANAMTATTRSPG